MKVYVIRDTTDDYIYKICGDRLYAQECVLDIAYETAIECMESNLDEFYNEMDSFEKGDNTKWRNHFSSYFSFFLYSVSTEIEIIEYEVEF